MSYKLFTHTPLVSWPVKVCVPMSLSVLQLVTIEMTFISSLEHFVNHVRLEQASDVIYVMLIGGVGLHTKI